MKKERQDAILSLIAAEEIATQEMLRERLETRGFAVTQATLSRDIRELKLTKEPRDGGKACYTVLSPQYTETSDIVRSAVLRTDFAGHIAVVHCRTGTAQAVAAALDAVRRENVVGTIAGDDTVFVLLRTEAQAREFAANFGAQTATGGNGC